MRAFCTRSRPRRHDRAQPERLSWAAAGGPGLTMPRATICRNPLRSDTPLSSLDRHLQTLAWRHYEEARGAPMRDVALEASAIAAAPDLPARIEARALAWCARTGIDATLSRYQGRERHARRIAVALGLLGGLAAARLMPEGLPARANVVAMLGGLLLPNLLSLCAWLVLQLAASLRGRGAVGAWFGQTLARGIDWLGARRHAHGGEAERAVQRALFEFHADTTAGRARVAALSHLFWLALACGAMLACWWLLVVRQVDFYWGSTLLGTDFVARALEALAQPVAMLGFPVPDAADIAASRLDAAPADAALRTRWGWLVLGSLCVFGVLPRLAALGWCLALARWSTRRPALDLTRPGFWRLRGILQPAPSQTRIVDRDEAPPVPRQAQAVPAGLTPPADAAWLALERSLPAPPGATDFGAIVDRAGQLRVLDALARAAQPWQAVVIQAPLAVTPDRGLGQFVSTVVAAARQPVYLLIAVDAAGALTPAERDERLEDWRALAGRAGIPAGNVGSDARAGA